MEQKEVVDLENTPSEGDTSAVTHGDDDGNKQESSLMITSVVGGKDASELAENKVGFPVKIS